MVSPAAIVPIAYLILVLGSLTVFVTIYRRRRALESSNLEPWLHQHRARDIYLTLLHLDTPVCPTLLKAALLERAREDISRIHTLRENKTAATTLLQKGSISESTFQQILDAEAILNAEIEDVMAEAKALGGEEWEQTIMSQANEYHQKNTVLETIDRAKKIAETERKTWDEKESSRKEDMDKPHETVLKELAGDDSVGTFGISNGDVVLARKIPKGDGIRSAKQKAKKRKKKK
jgi:translocation protein SEC66